MTSTSTRCEHCGTTVISFDPPIVIELDDSPRCNAETQRTVHCISAEGHDEKHMGILEDELVRWD